MRRLSILVAVLTAVALSCSSETESPADSTDTESPADSTETEPPGGSESAQGAEFEIPSELLDRVQAAGFDVVDVDYPDQPDGVAWPTEEWPTGPLPHGVDQDAVDEIIDSAFNGGTGESDVIEAILVVKDGRLVVEEYNGWDPEAMHTSWSMAKSITASLVGILAGRGEIDVFDRAAAPEWDDPEDPRHPITVDQLLRMSSGLEWTEDYVDPQGDVLSILAGDPRADRAGYTAAKPLEADPDTTWEYSTGTADIVAREVAMKVGFGEEYVSWIQENLFNPLGIEGAEHQLDDAGVTNGGSWINLRPVDFARFGYLFLRGGQWDGDQILPEAWVDYSRLPTPTADDPEYGAHWWIEEDDSGVFWASGFNGQSITVVPEDDLLVVILSNSGAGRDDVIRTDLMELFGSAQ